MIMNDDDDKMPRLVTDINLKFFFSFLAVVEVFISFYMNLF